MSVVDHWFAWYPVRLGALGTGRWVWLRRVWRNRFLGVAIYQPIELDHTKSLDSRKSQQ